MIHKRVTIMINKNTKIRFVEFADEQQSWIYVTQRKWLFWKKTTLYALSAKDDNFVLYHFEDSAPLDLWDDVQRQENLLKGVGV